MPLSATNAIRQFSPRKTIGTTFFTANRFRSLRDSSPADSLRGTSTNRDRSVSSKRKSDDTLSYAAVTGSGPVATSDPLIDPELLDKIQTDIVKVSNMCDKASHDFSKSGVDPAIFIPFNGICEAVKLIVNVQEGMLEALLRANKSQVSQQRSGAFPSGAFPKRPRKEATQVPVFVNLRKTAPPKAPTKSAAGQADQGESEFDNQVDPTVMKFKEAVKEAEKSTLIFNLNMGKVPIMNKNSMSTKATVALTEMAAATEGKHSSIPSEEAVATIDDVLSMVTGMTFFGKSTKTYKNPKDPLSGAYCSIPVRYTFKNKDTRIRAETALRDKCKINCSTPYPTILRETIRQTVSHFKNQFTDNQVRVTVDTVNLGLKVARRPKDSPTWQEFKRHIPLPAEVFDVNARQVPDGFRVRGLPEPDPDPNPNPVPVLMDTGPALQTSPRMSRQELHLAAKTASPIKKK